jgi:glutaconate CoA-transferase subunit A
MADAERKQFSSYASLRGRMEARDRSFCEKVMTLPEAAALVADGNSLGIGGSMFSRTPMAMIWQLIRAQKKNLVCSKSIIASDGDLLFGAGVSRHIITSWFSQGIMFGVSKVMRHFTETGRGNFEEWSHMAVGMRFRAGAMGVPFLPMRAMLGSSMENTRPETKRIDCPFTGEPVLLVPALNPDVAILHVQRCDRYGNAQIDGMPFMDIDLAMAADRVIITTERIVSNDQIRRAPDQTKIPFFCADAVVEVPYGAAPHECHGEYEPLMKHIGVFASLVNTNPLEGMREYLDRYVYGPESWNGFLNLIGLDELQSARRQARRLHDD